MWLGLSQQPVFKLLLFCQPGSCILSCQNMGSLDHLFRLHFLHGRTSSKISDSSSDESNSKDVNANIHDVLEIPKDLKIRQCLAHLLNDDAENDIEFYELCVK